jgi:hypothetical protein
MSLTPVTTVTKDESKQASIIEKITSSSREFISSLYHDTVSLLDSNYYTSKQNILVVTIFADTDFNKTQFQTSFQQHLQELYPQIDKVVINRQHDTSDENIPLTKNQQIQQDVRESFQSFFSETALHKLEVTSTTQQMQILIEASTPLEQEQFTQHIRSREILLTEIYEKQVATTTYINQLTLVK